ncbi:MAG: OadG family protein [Gammaproteobacteria bacterium]|uniref:OadG family protein n=1 Tax=SAR86 cluster bacterium TaxID=2030880 RepID=A0A838YSD1_9GAMM|nr:OadG family protein [SAR86 cluster bacterium]
MSGLLSQGIDLMLSGMFTVFLFLCLLIVSINTFAYLLKEKNNNSLSLPADKVNEINTDHLKIIKAIGERIQNEK